MMISWSRPLIRVDRVLKLANSCAKSKPSASIQGCCSCRSLNFSKRLSGPKHRLGSLTRTKKQKTVTCMSKTVSTQASSMEEHLMKDVRNDPEDGGQLEEGHGQEVIDFAEAASIETNVSITSNLNDENIQDRGLEGNSLHSVKKHSLSVEVGSSLMRFIRGKGGSTQKEIEEEINVKILFPSSKKNDTVVIEGISFDRVTKAAEKIQEIIDEAVNSRSLDYSHFVSLPLAIHPELVDKLVYFQNSILRKSEKSLDENLESDSNEDNSDNEGMDQKLREGCDVDVEFKIEDDNHVKVDRSSIPLVTYAPKPKPAALSDLGIDKSIFIKPKTFHLTVLMLKLWNKERINAAAEVLKNISVEVMDVLEHRPVFIRLKGLDCMKGSLAKARVLYAAVEEIGSENRLLLACDVIKNAFVQAGLVLEKDANQNLKLHATVMNVRHRKGRRNDSFDARGIFQQFGSEEWGEYLIREAHLSQRFVFDKNGYYHCCASIPFPESMQED